MLFEESGLLFTFSDAWQVHPFDDHRYYRWLSGRGLRGVDFVGIYQGKLIFMEVKNYRRREGMPATDAFEAVRQAPEVFAHKMVEKLSGTLRVVKAVHNYYRRRWWFSWFERLPQKWQRHYPQRYFWYIVSEMAMEPDQCIFVLWLDADSETQSTAEKIRKKMAGYMAGEAGKVVLAGQHGHPFGKDVEVTRVWKD